MSEEYQATDRDDMAARIHAAIDIVVANKEPEVGADRLLEICNFVDIQQAEAQQMADLILWRKWGLPLDPPPIIEVRQTIYDHNGGMS